MERSHPTMGAWIEISENQATKFYNWTSHPTMGAWIEIFMDIALPFVRSVAPHDGCVDWNYPISQILHIPNCRTPRWVRGLKYLSGYTYANNRRSHPTMGAWIEIFATLISSIGSDGRTPRWVRGLKSWINLLFISLSSSHPTMGAWIEISVTITILSGSP